jgi:hypothetical protein
MPPIHDIIQTTLLVVITVFSIGRWAQQRQDKEADGVKDTGALKRAFESYCELHKGEHDNIWKENERQRRRWHDDLTPWRQQVAEKLARLDEHERSQDSQLQQLWSSGPNRRRAPRDEDDRR